jgi:hypothetical protein
MKAIKRLNVRSFCTCRKDCPDFFELDNGDFAFIGEDITADAASILLPDSGVGPTERLIRVPRAIITSAKPQIPDA